MFVSSVGRFKQESQVPSNRYVLNRHCTKFKKIILCHADSFRDTVSEMTRCGSFLRIKFVSAVSTTSSIHHLLFMVELESQWQKTLNFGHIKPKPLGVSEIGQLYTHFFFLSPHPASKQLNYFDCKSISYTMQNPSIGPNLLVSVKELVCVVFPELKCPAPQRRRKRTTIMDVITSLCKNHSSELPNNHVFSHLLLHSSGSRTCL